MFFFSSRRRHTRLTCDWSSDVCSSDLVGIILALEVSRLARNNAAWYRLLDLAGVCDTLVADADGVYHPALFNDRLVLGRSEERRVGKECRSRWAADYEKKKKRT